MAGCCQGSDRPPQHLITLSIWVWTRTKAHPLSASGRSEICWRSNTSTQLVFMSNFHFYKNQFERKTETSRPSRQPSRTFGEALPTTAEKPARCQNHKKKKKKKLWSFCGASQLRRYCVQKDIHYNSLQTGWNWVIMQNTEDKRRPFAVN